MVTEPLPPLVIVTFVPATICVTPPFKAYDAVDANEAVPANCEVLEPVYELKEAVVNNPLPPPPIAAEAV